ncbi:SRPBCC family protein [Yoonia litorea]|uniref:Uncharacterized conserved protein YndB, AHSA1/START domain n=1 Tax=Yoonia litorea TaxID=1123755 RepID=A0A1I6LER4_9RHOB|nr:SRPBCC domain-containing protein [Yoonia litorea]SFS01966.1 Uncharacterized conserved protein YndB, AHSA1/START domain [Yoonia litorea]
MTEWVKITRSFDAPIADVWDMWTDPAKFQSWYGPMGFSVPVAEMDVTVGGTRKINMAMETPERKMSMWFTGLYKVVDAPNRLVYTESMCDPNGNVISPKDMGMPEGTPEVTEVTVELSEQDGKTVMVMTHAGVPAGTPGEGGWNMAFDKLGGLLGAA